jgi:beta-barrel assembly-enhancing protease
MSTYSATYHTAAGFYYQATVFLSAVTITIRYRDEENQEKDVYWLTKDLVAFNKQIIGGELQYRNAGGGIERLGIRDQQLVEALQKALAHHRLFGKVHNRVLGNSWIKLALIAGIVLLLLLSTYLWLIPYLGERMAKGFSKQAEIDMGEQMYQSVKLQYRIESQKTAILNDFYKQLHYDVGYPVSITVVASDEMNAFAIPGGHIVVYDAILDQMKTPEELAALLGHEASHIALRHSLRNIFRSMARQLFISIIIGDHSNVATAVINNADALKGLQYSRSLETEADNNGLQLMEKSTINPQGMMRLMQMLQKDSTGGGERAAFLSTHPVFKDRIQNIEKQIQQWPPVTTANDSLKTIFHSIYE